jgi:glutamate synthase (NADPH/NADH) large chain
VAYVYAPDRDAFRLNCNLELVELETVEAEADIAELKELIGKHANLTGSTVAAGILDTWAESLPAFVKVMPRDYKRALAEMAAAEALEAAGA